MFITVDLGLTLVSVAISDPSVRIGVLRPESSIPPKLGELAGVGIAVGVLSCVTRKKWDSVLVAMNAAFVLLLDLDHVPSTIGLAQPIRPAHSLGFLLVALIGLLVLTKKTSEMEFVLLSSFFAHMSVDTGLFGFFEPFSFSYASLDGYKLLFAGLSVFFALVAGRVRYMRLRIHVG